MSSPVNCDVQKAGAPAALAAFTKSARTSCACSQIIETAGALHWRRCVKTARNRMDGRSAGITQGEVGLPCGFAGAHVRWKPARKCRFDAISPRSGRLEPALSRCSPKTERSASTTSPSVTRPDTASTIGGRRLRPSRAASATAAAQPVRGRRVAPRAQRREARDLVRLHGRVDHERRDRPLLADGELVHADDDLLLVLDRPLRLVGRVLDLALVEAGLDRLEGAAHRRRSAR